MTRLDLIQLQRLDFGMVKSLYESSTPADDACSVSQLFAAETYSWCHVRRCSDGRMAVFAHHILEHKVEGYLVLKEPGAE